MTSIEIGITLTFTTPPSVGAGGSTGTLADKVVTRNAQGQFIVPASQLKGKLRHACEQILRAQNVPLCRPPRAEDMCPQVSLDGTMNIPEHNAQPRCLLCQIFGSPGYPCRLRFHDLKVRQDNLPEETLRQMVSINRTRRTAEDKKLFLIETAPHFDRLQFHHSAAITGYVDEEKHLHLLLASLKFLFAWGGGSSRGLGWGQAEVLAKANGAGVQFKAQEVKALWA